MEDSQLQDVLQDGVCWQNNNRLSFFMFTRASLLDSTNWCISFDFCSILICLGNSIARISVHERKENAAAKKNPLGLLPGKTNQFPYNTVKCYKGLNLFCYQPMFPQRFFYDFRKGESRHWSKVIWKWHLENWEENKKKPYQYLMNFRFEYFYKL